MESRPFGDYWFAQFLKEHKLMGSRCTACHALFVPPRPLCGNCHGANMQWEQMKGTGRLVAFTCIAIGPPAMAEQGYDRDNPYCCGVVELEEKAKVVARIEGVDTRNHGAVRIGTPLQVEFLQEGSGQDLRTVLAFKPRHEEP